MKISAVYKITNEVTKDFYIGSSKDVEHRWKAHKCPSTWKKCPNNLLYKDMQKYGRNCFKFEILVEVTPECLKKTEQGYISLMRPTYNNYYSNGWNIERFKKTKTKYSHTEKCKEARKKYEQSEKGREVQRKAQRKYYQTDKGKEVRKRKREFDNRLCEYNNEKLTLHALRLRFYRAGIPNPYIEAKKYLI